MNNRKNQGYTMIIVMCLMFLFMALALSMLFSSAVLLARAERAAAQKQSVCGIFCGVDGRGAGKGGGRGGPYQ